MCIAALTSVRFAAAYSWPQAVQGIGVALGLVLAGMFVLRAAIILHNKKMAFREEQTKIIVPGWSYAACVMLLALLVDASILAGITLSTDAWRSEWLLVALALRLPLHTGVLAWTLAASYRSAMIVQVFEIAIAMTVAPVAAAVLAIAYGL